MADVDAASHHYARKAAAPKLRTPAPARYPHRLTFNLDDDLVHAIQSASELDCEPEGVIVRRWLRAAARQLGLLPQGGSNGR